MQPVHIKKKGFDECITSVEFTVKHPTLLVMKGNNNNSGNEQEARVFWLSICTHTTTSNTDECVEVATKTTDANVANLWAWQICYLIWIAAGLRQFTAYLL